MIISFYLKPEKLENEISQSQIISPFSPLWLISDHNEYAMHIWLVLSKLKKKRNLCRTKFVGLIVRSILSACLTSTFKTFVTKKLYPIRYDWSIVTIARNMCCRTHSPPLYIDLRRFHTFNLQSRYLFIIETPGMDWLLMLPSFFVESPHIPFLMIFDFKEDYK
jgi:hypothetical protein